MVALLKLNSSVCTTHTHNKKYFDIPISNI
jgi:hypothetical protein